MERSDDPANGGLEVAPDPPPEEIRQTAPVFPWELCLRQCVRFYQKLPGGGMAVKFAPALRHPSGQVAPMPPAVEVAFDAAGWRQFQREVAGDGDAGPTVQTATAIPSLRPVG